MITRVISTSDKFNLLNANSKTVNTSGYKSAKIKVKATYTEGNYGSCSAYISDILGNNLKLLGKKM